MKFAPSLVVAAVSLAICSPSLAARQDFQVRSRAKGMGGSYTAFGDDPVAVWTNPAGTAAQPSQLAITYQSFTEYEFNHVGDQISPDMFGAPKQGLLDPPISPSFAGVVVQIGDSDLEMAASLAYIRPFQIKYVYFFNGAALNPPDNDLLTQTDQQFSRIRAAYALSFKLSESSPFFKKLAVGIGLDYVYTTYKEIDQNTDPNRDSQVYEDSQSAVGFGAGLLATLYESSSFMVDAGVAYNSKVHFHFAL
jgi:long-subunit fatty acid transport protein